MAGKMEHERKLGLCRHRIEGFFFFFFFFKEILGPLWLQIILLHRLYLGLPQWDREFGNPQMFGKLSFGDMFALGKP